MIKKDGTELVESDFLECPVWVTPDGDNLIPLVESDDEFYPDYIVLCNLALADGSKYTGTAFVGQDLDGPGPPYRDYVISANNFESQWPINFSPMMRTREIMDLIEQGFGKTEKEIFPLRIQIMVKYIYFDLDMDIIEDYPYVRESV